MINVIIAGGRHFNDEELLFNSCNKILWKHMEPETKLNHIGSKEDITIVSGCAAGADSLGIRYASVNNLQLIRKPADWDRYGKSAGYRRNEEMAKIGHILIAFWDYESKGTKHMIDLAKSYGLEVFIIPYKEEN